MNTTKQPAATQHGSLKTYTIGFGLSIALTLVAYLFVNAHVTTGHHTYAHDFLIAIVLILASVQLLVQLVFFLHVGQESKPFWNLQALLFAVGIIAIVVIGTMWIMHNLDYRMTPSEMNNYLQSQDSL